MQLATRLITLVSLSFLTFGLAHASETTPDTIDGTTKVTAEEVIELVGSLDEIVIVDARKSSDRAQGWIEDSIGLPNTDTTEESLAKIAPNKAVPIMFYCNGVKCGRSVESARNAIKWGYSKVYWFRGGMSEWEAKSLPVVKE